MKTYRALMSNEEFEAYSSPKISDEKVFKALKILFSGRELKISENDKVVLMETNNKGFAFVNVLDGDRIINADHSFTNVMSILNNLDDGLLEEQYNSYCFSVALRESKRR